MLLQLRPSALPFALLLLIVLSSPSSLLYQILAEMKEDSINMEFFGLDQLCLLCQAVVGRWKSQMEANGMEALKLELLSSCLLFKQQEEAKKCEAKINGTNLGRLGEENAEKICESEGICKKGTGKAKEALGRTEEQAKLALASEGQLRTENGTATNWTTMDRNLGIY